MTLARGGPRAAASPPPLGLPGLDPAWSRLVDSTDALTGSSVTWHLLDTGAALEALGATPVGTIVAVHGNPTWSYLWRRLAAETLRRAGEGGPAWRVIAPDQLEMGFSERTGATRRLADRVRDIGALTDVLDLDGPVVALGHDWGGVVAMGWAVDHPGQLSALTLLNTAIHQPEGSPIPAPLRLALAPGVLSTASTVTPAFLDTTLALGHPVLTAGIKRAYRAPYLHRDRRAGIAGFVADIPATASHWSAVELDRIAEGIRHLGVPSLLQWGPEDPIFSDRYLDDLIDRMPHSDVHRYEGAGHLIAEDVDYAGALLDWLDARRETPAPASAVTGAGAGAAGSARRPLWSNLDALSASAETALVELAPPSGSEPRTISWSLLSRRVRELASGLAAAGVGAGDRVSLLVPPGADLTAALYACLRIGAVVVVADAGLGIRGLTRAVRGAHPDVVIGAAQGLAAARALGWPGRRISTTRLGPAQRAVLGVTTSLPDLARRGAASELPPEPSADAVAAVLFTSGSTGPAKGVVYTHAQLEALRDLLATQYGVGVGTGLVAGFAPFALLGPALGARTATPDMDVSAPRTLTAEAVAAAVAAVQGRVVFLSPAAIANVVATADGLADDDRAALSGVELVLSAGAPVSVELLDGITALMPGATAHTPYGMTEGLLMTDITLDGIRAAGSASAVPTRDAEITAGGVCVGRPAPGVSVLIAPLDADGAATGLPAAAAGVTGEVVVSAPHLKQGYDQLWLTDEAAVRDTAELSPSRGGDARWHRTGDVGHLDADGRLWIEGRLPHVVVTADGVVTPVGPEQRIGAVAGVARVGIAGVGPRGTQQVIAIVETVPAARRPGLAAPELAAAARSAAGVPLAAVLVVPRLPTDIRHNSKIDRARLSRWAERVLAGGRMSAP
ncbi:alpha/beta fold hydrolase [Amnibacterium flavum]|uniref:alpha/beta fold hydrolase n=1 Tax=Amnibacterium flavum TaxID=2173173 RepID=UPI001401EA6C|nr:alpha/beta fold hydrolase [Amnibacterium flavum]